MTPFLLVLSAPSGGGKTTIAKALLAAREDVGYSVSATTRKPRGNEQDGRDYHFLSDKEFDARVARGDFLEWAEYGGARYGTLKDQVERVLASGRHVVLDIDVQGARTVRRECKNVVAVFILPPSAQALIERLGGRNTERLPDLLRRLHRAVDELTEAPAYDYVVVNTDRTQAVAEVAAIIDAEAHRPGRWDDLPTMVRTLQDDLRREIEGLAPPEE
ncbi:MAG TPA: guanylate kinase [Gemmatimonadales bacterium]|nr:guanylate kinase [Gemmatimonadales bacterium]